MHLASRTWRGLAAGGIFPGPQHTEGLHAPSRHSAETDQQHRPPEMDDPGVSERNSPPSFLKNAVRAVETCRIKMAL